MGNENFEKNGVIGKNKNAMRQTPAANGRFGASGAVARGQGSTKMTFCGSWQ